MESEQNREARSRKFMEKVVTYPGLILTGAGIGLAYIFIAAFPCFKVSYWMLWAILGCIAGTTISGRIARRYTQEPLVLNFAIDIGAALGLMLAVAVMYLLR